VNLFLILCAIGAFAWWALNREPNRSNNAPDTDGRRSESSERTRVVINLPPITASIRMASDGGVPMRKPKGLRDMGLVNVALIATARPQNASVEDPASLAVLMLLVDAKKGNVIKEIEALLMYEPWNSENLTKLDGSLGLADILVSHNAAADRKLVSSITSATEGKPWACSIRSLGTEWDRHTGGSRSLRDICSAMGVEHLDTDVALGRCRQLQYVLTKPSGKTDRSMTYLAKLLANPRAPIDDVPSN